MLCVPNMASHLIRLPTEELTKILKTCRWPPSTNVLITTSQVQKLWRKSPLVCHHLSNAPDLQQTQTGSRWRGISNSAKTKPKSANLKRLLKESLDHAASASSPTTTASQRRRLRRKKNAITANSQGRCLTFTQLVVNALASKKETSALRALQTKLAAEGNTDAASLEPLVLFGRFVRGLMARTSVVRI